MIKNYLRIILLLITVTSCITSRVNYLTNDIKIDDNVLKNAKISDIVESVRYIPLEYTEKSVIGFIPKIVFYDEYIIVQNMVSMNSKVLAFDTEGKFIADIFDNGRANNEIIRMNDFDVSNNEVLVLDNSRKRINRYSLTGNYIGNFQLPFYATAFSVLDNNNFLFRLTPSNPFFIPVDNYRVVTVNEKFELIDKIGNYNSELENVQIGRTPYFVENTFTFPNENEMISANTEGKLEAIYTFNSEKNKISKIDSNNPEIPISASEIELYNAPIESSTLLTLSVNSGDMNKKGFVIYDKKNNLSCFIGKDYVLDRDDMFKISPPIAYCPQTDEFVYVTTKVTKEDIKNVGLDDVFKRMSKSNKDILVGDPTTSNIILVFVKFKDVKKLIEKYKTK